MDGGVTLYGGEGGMWSFITRVKGKGDGMWLLSLGYGRGVVSPYWGRDVAGEVRSF